MRRSRDFEFLASHRSYYQELSAGLGEQRDAPFPEISFRVRFGPATRPVTDEELRPERTIRGTLKPDPPGVWNTVRGPEFSEAGGRRRREIAYRIDYDRGGRRFTMTLRGSGSRPDRVLDLSNPRDRRLATVVLIADTAQRMVSSRDVFTATTSRDLLRASFERMRF